MILTRLELTNFKKYLHKSFSFAEGLIGIVGANGSGKSSIFDAILFAMYGELPHKNKELIKNSNVDASEAVSVILEFELEEGLYKIVREFRGKNLVANAKLYKNTELLANGAREVTSLIARLVKMNKSAFLHTLFASQKELTSLSSLHPEERKKMIRRLLGLEKIDKMEEGLVERSRELKREINAFAEVLFSSEEVTSKEELIASQNESKNKLEKEVKNKDKQLEVLKKQENESKQELDNLQKTKEQMRELENEIKLLQSTLQSLQEQQTKLTKERQELAQNEKELATLMPLRDTYLALQKELTEQQKHKEIQLKKNGLEKELSHLREQYTKANGDIKTLKEEVQKHQEIQTTHTATTQSLQTLTAQIKEQDAQIKTTQALIAGEQKLIETTNKQIQKIQKIGKGSNCPTCTRPLLEEYDKVLTSLSATIKEAQTDKIDIATQTLRKQEQTREELEANKSTLEKQIQELAKQLSIIEVKQQDLRKAQSYFEGIKTKGIESKEELKELTKYSYDENAHQALLQKEQELKPKYELAQELQTRVQRVDIVATELEQNASTKSEKETTLEQKQKEAKAVVYDETTHQSAQEALTTLTQNKDTLTTNTNELKVQIASIEGETKTLQNDLATNAKHQAKLATKHQDLSDYDKIKIALSQFKTKLNSKIAPRISQIASTMYAKITKGKYQHIEVDNDFDFFIYDEGQKYPIERFSGGEVDLANLVLRIAISKTLSELSGTSNIGFLAFDEVFGSQDESRRMEILEAFHTIKEQYRQIFLISHEVEIKEMFERVIEV